MITVRKFKVMSDKFKVVEKYFSRNHTCKMMNRLDIYLFFVLDSFTQLPLY
jgi:hypothetical protein